MARRRGTKSSRASKSRGRKRARAAARGQWREEAAAQLGGHRADAVAIGLGVAGVLAALGIFSDLAGPFGRGIDTAAAVVLGAGKVIVPIALLTGAGVAPAQRHCPQA